MPACKFLFHSKHWFLNHNFPQFVDEEHVLAVGDSEGTVCVLSLPSDLWMPVENEVSFKNKMLVLNNIILNYYRII